MKKIIIVTVIILGLLALASFIILPKVKGGNEIQTAFEVPNAKNEITLPVVLVDESESTYATIFLAISQRVYLLAKDTPKYKTYIDMMENSIAHQIPLTFTLDKDVIVDSSPIIIKITKAPQKAIDYYNNLYSNSLEPIEVDSPSTRF